MAQHRTVTSGEADIELYVLYEEPKLLAAIIARL
jgi:hypothetical protein